LELLAQYDSRARREARSRHLAARDPQLRLSAVRSVSGLAPLELVPLLAPRLTDSIRSVRALAARLLAAAPRRALTPDQEKALDAALVEYVEGEKASADRAGAHMNLGSLYEELGDIEAAAEAYKTAVRLEPYLAGPRTNLAAIYDAGPDAPARLARLRDVKKARELREEELPFLRRDVELLPEDPMPRYRYAMALYLLGRLDDAQKQLVLLCEMAPREQQFRLMLTLLYEKRGDYDAALASLAELAKLGYNPQTVQNLRLKFQAARVRPGTGSRE